MAQTIKTSELVGKRVFISKPTKKNPDAVKKIGRVRGFVFSPNAPVCVGFLVRRPDVALMFRREDDFVAIGGFSVEEDSVYVGSDSADYGRGATKALALPLDDCVLWEGLAVITKSGKILGNVGSAEVDTTTGRVISITLNNGATANTLLGKINVPAELIVGFKRGIGARLADANPRKGGGDEYLDDEDPQNFGAILVDDAAASIAADGGVAAKAGEGAAKVAAKARKAGESAKVAVAAAEEKAAPTVKAATAAAGKAVNKGAFATGRQIGRATGMFKGFKENLDKAMKDDD